MLEEVPLLFGVNQDMIEVCLPPFGVDFGDRAGDLPLFFRLEAGVDGFGDFEACLSPFALPEERGRFTAGGTTLSDTLMLLVLLLLLLLEEGVSCDAVVFARAAAVRRASSLATVFPSLVLFVGIGAVIFFDFEVVRGDLRTGPSSSSVKTLGASPEVFSPLD